MAEGKTVFLSYSSSDALFVQNIVAMLEEMGISYWKAPEMIPAGSNYAREIPKAIKECKIFLLVVSKAAQASIWVEKELDSAINSRKIIVPIKIDDEPLSEVYKFYLNNVQMISFNEERTKVMKFVQEQLEGIVGVRRTTIYDEAESNNGDEYLKENIRRKNALTHNKAPEECKVCKGALKEISRGVYECVNCGTENYDYFQTVKRYLQKHGATNAVIIERETGVPRKVIDTFVKEDYLTQINNNRW